MKFRSSHLFYLFVIILVGSVYYFDYYKVEEDKKIADQNSVLIPILKENVARIELKNSSGEVELLKTETGWSLKKPVDDLAATDETNGWVQSITTEKSTEKIGEGESFEWSTYGLDKPMGTIIVYPKTGDKIQLQVSGKKNFEGNPFIKKNEEKVVYVGTSVWSSLVGRAAKELRDKKILRTPLTELESVSLLQGKTELELILKDGKWTSPSKSEWHLDQNKVREVVNAIQEMNANDFTLETEPDKSQAEKFGFTPPTLKVTYKLKGNKLWVADFGQDKEKNWYVWTHDLKRIMKVDIGSVEKLTKASLVSMRDREDPFVFTKEDVAQIKIKDEKSFNLTKEGALWKSADTIAINSDEVIQLLEHLRQLRISEFLDSKTKISGLESSKKSFVLADAKGGTLLDLRIGSMFKQKIDKVDKIFYYAKSSLFNDVFALSEDDLKTLSTEKLIKTEPKTKNEATSNDPKKMSIDHQMGEEAKPK